MINLNLVCEYSKTTDLVCQKIIEQKRNLRSRKFITGIAANPNHWNWTSCAVNLGSDQLKIAQRIL